MKKKHLVIVVFEFSRPPDQASLIKTMNISIDWIQITNTTWILWTSSSSAKWLDRLQKHLREDDEVFISELAPSDHAVRMDRSVYDFIQAKHARLVPGT